MIADMTILVAAYDRKDFEVWVRDGLVMLSGQIVHRTLDALLVQLREGMTIRFLYLSGPSRVRGYSPESTILTFTDRFGDRVMTEREYVEWKHMKEVRFSGATE